MHLALSFSRFTNTKKHKVKIPLYRGKHMAHFCIASRHIARHTATVVPLTMDGWGPNQKHTLFWRWVNVVRRWPSAKTKYCVSWVGLTLAGWPFAIRGPWMMDRSQRRRDSFKRPVSLISLLTLLVATVGFSAIFTRFILWSLFLSGTFRK